MISFVKHWGILK